MGVAYRICDGGTRTEAEGYDSIKRRTALENAAKEVVRQRFETACKCPTTITDSGVDNSGRAIGDNEKVEFDLPDWTIVAGPKTYKVEAMIHPEFHRTCSFKVTKLLAAVKRQFNIMVVRESYLIVFNIAACEWLLRNIPDRSVPSIFGGKPTIILDNDLIDQLIRQKMVLRLRFDDKQKQQLAVEMNKYIPEYGERTSYKVED